MILINFIFPQNYNFKPKILGIIDYKTIIICCIWCVFIFFIFNLIFDSLQLILAFSIILIFPVFLFGLIGFNGEDIGSVMNYMILFIIRPKVYVFSKVNNYGSTNKHLATKT